MSWFRQTIFLLPLALLGCTTSPDSSAVEAGDAPPVALVQENCQKADAIIQGKVVAVQDGQNGYSSALLKVAQAYRGPFHSGDTVRYYSFRSEKYDPSTLGKPFIVFLSTRKEEEQTSWGTATDLAEFPDNPATEKLFRQTLK
ncbi:hypothetical protein [Hymenobacter terrenus]|uniref:hypothetical protein n=1 Tax=Hymenobacter terrenus TaxID=1629124 RepID=UPI000619CBA5|nr:hypothetical protein [Hymenobacter terrenus]